MADPPITYFTCSLGQAATNDNLTASNSKTVNDFLKFQAQLYPKSPAVGFPVPAPDDGDWNSEIFCNSFISKIGLEH